MYYFFTSQFQKQISNQDDQKVKGLEKRNFFLTSHSQKQISSQNFQKVKNLKKEIFFDPPFSEANRVQCALLWVSEKIWGYDKILFNILCKPQRSAFKNFEFCLSANWASK